MFGKARFENKGIGKKSKNTMNCSHNRCNYILFAKDVNIQEIKRRLNIPVDKRVILYAPTYRGEGRGSGNRNVNESGLNQIKEIDFKTLFNILSKKFGGDWVFVGRFHYHVDK